MENLTKLDFIAFDVSGTNYLSWFLDAERHLASNKLGETIKENTSASEQDCAKAMILLRHHLHESLKSQYLTVKKENNQLLLNNHHTRPTSSKPLPEISAALPETNATSSRKGRGRYHGSPWVHSYRRGRGHGGRGRGRGNGRGNDHNTLLIPIFRRTMGTRQRINKRKLQMEIFAIDVGCLDIGPVPVVRHNI
ncbi:UNVERIFIED_CONTAM: hypothetical protein Sradi_3355200 [Sesamum radiatum]|uniref:Uncharacterized protein n=1 Tax=Sesamum radiatum TaxID=300843 RepID=A0AAW2R303_SESRA